MVSAPVVFVLINRKETISKIQFLLILLLGLGFGFLILPKDEQRFLFLFLKYTIPLVELAVFSTVLWKIVQIVKHYRANSFKRFDFFSILSESCLAVLPKGIAKFVTSEIAMFYYLFFCWKKYFPQENEFTYSKKNGVVAFLFAIIFIACIELLAVHFLLVRFYPTIAWILTLGSLYGLFQLLGIIKSISRRLIIVEDEILVLKYGYLRTQRIPIKEIEKIMVTKKALKKPSKLHCNFSPFYGIEGHNLLIKLHSNLELETLFGKPKDFNSIAIFVDEPEKLVAKIKA